LTRPLPDDRRRDVIEGGYWLVPPAEDAELAIACCGAVLPEALDAHALICDDVPGAGLLVVTSPDRLHRGWMRSQRSVQLEPDGSHIHTLLASLDTTAGLVTVLDGHPGTLSWLGAVRGQRVIALGV